MDIQRIIKYLEGKTNETESEKIRDWLKDKENNFLVKNKLEEIWSNYQIKLSKGKPNFNLLLHKVHQQINSKFIYPVPIPNKKFNRTLVLKSFSKVAAILIIPLLLFTAYLLFVQNNKTILPELSFIPIHEIYTKPGTRTKIELSDGTQVWLNDGTTFRYPERFTDNKRQVFLDGEAYFEVKSNPENPFVVDNSLVTTTVTGTHFNLSAYSDDKFFEATLMEGKIQLEKQDKRLCVSPGEQVQFDGLLNSWRRKQVNTTAASAWIEGKLMIQNEPLSIAVRKLSRWYNIEIILKDVELNDYLLTGTFEDEKLNQTIKLISLALPVDYEFKKEKNAQTIQRTIILTKR